HGGGFNDEDADAHVAILKCGLVLKGKT
ncbi:MAG: hypothetical protein RLZZ502_369, partial [Pseudomonadota bacterium]